MKNCVCTIKYVSKQQCVWDENAVQIGCSFLNDRSIFGTRRKNHKVTGSKKIITELFYLKQWDKMQHGVGLAGCPTLVTDRAEALTPVVLPSVEK